MRALTRRRDPDASREAWLIHFGDIHIGSIGMRAGVPNNVDEWQWRCGFYPASHRGVRADGTAKSFNEASNSFESAWRELLPQITEADFSEHRRYPAWDAWKRAMWDTGCPLPTQVADGRSRCFCGAEINIAGVEQHVNAAHIGRERPNVVQ
jgi:hypothetical protein